MYSTAFHRIWQGAAPSGTRANRDARRAADGVGWRSLSGMCLISTRDGRKNGYDIPVVQRNVLVELMHTVQQCEVGHLRHNAQLLDQFRPGGMAQPPESCVRFPLTPFTGGPFNGEDSRRLNYRLSIPLCQTAGCSPTTKHITILWTHFPFRGIIKLISDLHGPARGAIRRKPPRQ